MRPARVTFLGTGTSHGVPMIGCRCPVCRSSDPRDRRLRPSIYLDVADGPAILVDTATDLRQQALTHDLTRVDALLFTHSHADHVMGLDEVRRFNVLMGTALPAFADAATASRAAPGVRLCVRAVEGQGRRGAAAGAHRDWRAVRGRWRRGGADTAAARRAANPRVPLRPLRLPHRLQRDSRAVVRAAARPRRGGHRRAAPSAASDPLHGGRGDGGGPPHRRPAELLHPHLPRPAARRDLGEPARRHGAGPRRAGPGDRRLDPGTPGERSDGGRLLPGRSAAASVDESRARAGQLRRPPPWPPEDHRADPPRCRRPWGSPWC